MISREAGSERNCCWESYVFLKSRHIVTSRQRSCRPEIGLIQEFDYFFQAQERLLYRGIFRNCRTNAGRTIGCGPNFDKQRRAGRYRQEKFFAHAIVTNRFLRRVALRYPKPLPLLEPQPFQPSLLQVRPSAFIFR